MKDEFIIHMVIDDLKAAQHKLEVLTMELLGYKDDGATMFAGTLCGHESALGQIEKDLVAIAKDIEAGHAGGPQIEDPRVRELAEQLRALYAEKAADKESGE